MTSPNLDNLVHAGQLKREPGDQREFDGLVRSARARLVDARKQDLAIESRFDLAYNAAHALALAALRWHGYRSDNRYIVFQCLPHTLGVGPEVWRVLALCHQRRNRGEYEGFLDVDAQLVKDLTEAVEILDNKISGLKPLQ
jgi:hypothetical protein